MLSLVDAATGLHSSSERRPVRGAVALGLLHDAKPQAVEPTVGASALEVGGHDSVHRPALAPRQRLLLLDGGDERLRDLLLDVLTRLHGVTSFPYSLLILDIDQTTFSVPSYSSMYQSAPSGTSAITS